MIPNAIIVAAETVQQGQQGQFVFVVKDDQTVDVRQVATGRTFENRTIIERGVAAGESVVTGVHLRLAPGAGVQQMAPAPKVGVERS